MSAAPVEGLWSRLGAMGVNHGFFPSALVARALGRRDGCFGATIALQRQTLDAVGGLAPLRDILADDWALGAAFDERDGKLPWRRARSILSSTSLTSGACSPTRCAGAEPLPPSTEFPIWRR